MHRAFDHVAVEHAVGEARRAMGAFVIGDEERAAEIVDGEQRSPTSKRFTEFSETSEVGQTVTIEL